LLALAQSECQRTAAKIVRLPGVSSGANAPRSRLAVSGHGGYKRWIFFRKLAHREFVPAVRGRYMSSMTEELGLRAVAHPNATR
jgi:hypothetical protein